MKLLWFALFVLNTLLLVLFQVTGNAHYLKITCYLKHWERLGIQIVLTVKNVELNYQQANTMIIILNHIVKDVF